MHRTRDIGKFFQNANPAKFLRTSPEGTGDTVDRQERLLISMEDHLPLIERYENQIGLNDQALTRFKNANRRGSSRHRGWEDVNLAIE